jgi:chromosome segregation ATPase
VGKAEEDLEVSKLDLKKRAAVLADGQKDIDKKDGELSLLLQEVQKQKDVARKSRAKGGQMLVRAEKVLKRAEERYEEVMTFESEKRKLLVDKEEHLDHQLKLTKKKRRLYEDSLEWVEKEKQKIASQWQALLSAKAHIDG